MSVRALPKCYVCGGDICQSDGRRYDDDRVRHAQEYNCVPRLVADRDALLARNARLAANGEALAARLFEASADRDRYRSVLVALRDAAARYNGDHSAESRAIADAACKAAFAAVEEGR